MHPEPIYTVRSSTSEISGEKTVTGSTGSAIKSTAANW